MSEPTPKLQLPPIPAKRYFTIGEVSELCGVKPHVLRYWEQEFTQLKPVKRRGNRRYYQHHEVLLIRRIRELLYEQGFTISGARNRLDGPDVDDFKPDTEQLNSSLNLITTPPVQDIGFDFESAKAELLEILSLLRPILKAS
jgi:DNA-binding transcriptional MerR regulator